MCGGCSSDLGFVRTVGLQNVLVLMKFELELSMTVAVQSII